LKKNLVSAINNLETAEDIQNLYIHHELAENGQKWSYSILRSLMSDTLVISFDKYQTVTENLQFRALGLKTGSFAALWE
jgi:hypothetical protein